ncbi:unnamed protein product [Protopolystoma xenopodis]|uniref:Uncharacterized protein n=1 Tax=Protopolystoma xenopodis TaxID=117903 RepID=A0A448X194_9PLAT|nr:unnamed protein product [Protopolystoma xenopodis]
MQNACEVELRCSLVRLFPLLEGMAGLYVHLCRVSEVAGSSRSFNRPILHMRQVRSLSSCLLLMVIKVGNEELHQSSSLYHTHAHMHTSIDEHTRKIDM